MGKIFWLASYPKSGNTWLRIFLTNYWRNCDQPADINALDSTPIAGSRSLFDEMSGVDAADLQTDEIERTRPAVYRLLAEQQQTPIFIKVHDNYRLLADGQPLFPPEVSAGAIYIVRNPLDVAISFAAHNRQPIAKMLENLGCSEYGIAQSVVGLNEQLYQHLGSWSDHVRSWVDCKAGFPLCVIRYEEMLTNPSEVFARVIDFLGEPLDSARIKRAIDFASFAQVRQQEDARGFRERPGQADRFFRSGRVGEWQSQLSNEQVERVKAQHREMMHRFGYGG